MRFGDWHPNERLLSLLAGNDLGVLPRQLVRRHVARCDQCASTVAGFQGLRSELARAKPVPEMDFEALAHQIRAAAALDPIRPSAGRWRWNAAAGAGLAAAIAVALLLPVENRDSHEPDMVGAIPSEATWSMPGTGAGTEAQLTAEGGLTVRAFHSGSGTLTVTDYYAP